jgi:hypothetical protein
LARANQAYRARLHVVGYGTNIPSQPLAGFSGNARFCDLAESRDIRIIDCQHGGQTENLRRSRLRSPQVVCDKGFDAGLKMPFPATRGFFCGLLRPGGHFLGFFDHA